MVDFDEKDFRNLMYNVYKVPEDAKTRIMDYFPDLKKFQEFQVLDKKKKKKFNTPLSFDKCFRLVVLLYDRKTPFNQIDEIGTRKREAALFVGFSLNDDKKFPKAVEQLLYMQNIHFVAMVIRYLLVHRNADYAYYKNMQDRYFQALSNHQMKPGDVKASKTMMTDAYDDLVNYDNSKVLHHDLYKFVEDDLLDLRPEDIAKRLNEGRNPLGLYNPYK